MFSNTIVNGIENRMQEYADCRRELDLHKSAVELYDYVINSISQTLQVKYTKDMVVFISQTRGINVFVTILSLNTYQKLMNSSKLI